MTGVLRLVTRFVEDVEGLTLAQSGRPTRRWSWFQIAWAGLHSAALVMHLFSVLYHVRRIVSTENTEPLFVAGCPALHVRTPVAIAARRGESGHEARTAVS